MSQKLEIALNVLTLFEIFLGLAIAPEGCMPSKTNHLNMIIFLLSERLFSRADSFPLMRKLAQDRFADKICKQVNLSIAR